jgi:hypothetical protein
MKNFLKPLSQRDNGVSKTFSKQERTRPKLLKKEITILNLRPSFYPLSKQQQILQTYESVSNKKLQGNLPVLTLKIIKEDQQIIRFKGKYVYIDIWATGAHHADKKSLQKIEKIKRKKIAFVSISIDEKKDYEKWKKFVSAKTDSVADKDLELRFHFKIRCKGNSRFIL